MEEIRSGRLKNDCIDGVISGENTTVLSRDMNWKH